jgi:hypothetical protein
MVGVVKVGVVSVWFVLEPLYCCIAFNTELTRKLSVTTESPDVQALTKTTVVPVVAV